MFAETIRHSDDLYQYRTSDIWTSSNNSTAPFLDVTTNSLGQTWSLPGSGTGLLISSDILNTSRTNIRSSAVNIPDNQRHHPPKKINNRTCLVPLEVISRDEIDYATSSQCYSNGMPSIGKSGEEFCLETDIMFKLHSRKYKKPKKSTKKSKSFSQVQKSLVAIPVNPRISSATTFGSPVLRVSTQPNLQTNLEVLSAHCNAATIHEQIDPKPPKSSHHFHRGRNLNNSKNTHVSHSQTKYVEFHQQDNRSGSMSKSCVCQAASSQIQLSKRTLAQAESVYLQRVPKVYLSEKHSGVIREEGLDFPCAPPATPTAEQLRRYEYVPSLNDVKAQRAVRHKLQIMEKKEQQKMDRKKDEQVRADKIHMKEREKELRRRQRQEIYALNKIMTDLEHKRFVEFCHSKGLVS